MIYFNGKSSDDFGIVVERFPNRPLPERKYETASITGMNGDVYIGQNAFKNYEQQYEVFIRAVKDKVEKQTHRVIEWLYSADGYAKLSDDYDKGVYKYAFFVGGIDLENLHDKYGRATISFNCKPQRYFYSGDEIKTIETSGAKLTNPSIWASKPLIKVYGTSGSISIADKTVDIDAIDGYVELDCESQNAYKGNINKNNTIHCAEFPIIPKGTQEIEFDGNITKIEITPRWWTL